MISFLSREGNTIIYKLRSFYFFPSYRIIPITYTIRLVIQLSLQTVPKIKLALIEVPLPHVQQTIVHKQNIYLTLVHLVPRTMVQCIHIVRTQP